MVIAIVVVVLLSGGAWVVYGTGVLDAREVAVSGVRTLNRAQVVAAAGVPIGQPLAKVDLAAVERRVRALPAVKAAEVGRSWPHRVTVAVTERVAVAAVAEGGGFRLMDQAGVAFRTVERKPAGLPELKVDGVRASDPATKAALTVAAALTPKVKRVLVSISAPTPNQVTLALTGDRRVRWGDASASDRKARLVEILLSRKGKVIDVSAPDVVTVR